MAFMFAHIKLRPGKVQKFTEMLSGIVPLVEKHGGWKLHGSHHVPAKRGAWRL